MVLAFGLAASPSARWWPTRRPRSHAYSASLQSSASMGECSSVRYPVARRADGVMAPPRRVRGFTGLQQAFDEVRFGATRTLNLRGSLPTGAEAARRVETWLRQHKVQQSGELL